MTSDACASFPPRGGEEEERRKFSCVAKRLLGADFAPSEDLTSAYLHAASSAADAADGEGKEASLRGTDDFLRKYAVILEKLVLGTRGIPTKEEACLLAEEEEAWAYDEEAYLDRLRDEWSFDTEELKRDVHDAQKDQRCFRVLTYLKRYASECVPSTPAVDEHDLRRLCELSSARR